MKGLLLALVFVTAVGTSGCRQHGCGAPDEFQRPTVKEADGRTAFYTGVGIADKLARGENVDDLLNVVEFTRVRVPEAILQEARDNPRQRKILSMEVLQTGVDITFHTADPLIPEVDDDRGCRRVQRAMNLDISPGHAGVSGRVGIYAHADGTFTIAMGWEYVGERFGFGGGGSEVCNPSDDPEWPMLFHQHPDRPGKIEDAGTP